MLSPLGRMSRPLWIILCASCALHYLLSTAWAQGLRGQEKQILGMTEGSWVHFRDFNGRQLIYFTHLEVYRCGITKVRYSLNSDALDQEYALQPCNPENPNAVTTDRPYISLPLGTAQSISVEITFEDGTKSGIVRANP